MSQCLVFQRAAAERLVVAVEAPAAIAHEAAALGRGAQFAERVDAILQRSGSLRDVRRHRFHTRRVQALGP